jgi:crotonobetainyl-CoA:carnitine CoA-transferase CaiB-like acyl-CoA transferase
MTGALNDLRVIELCDEAGTWAGKLLADMGADVIKVEPPAGTITRAYPPFYKDEPHPDRSLTFWHYNTSKRGVTLDLEQPEARDVFKRLVASADMLIEDQPPGRMAAWGLDYPDLSRDHEGLIMVSLTPFGRSGPRSEEQATDLTLLAGGGPVWSCGYDDHSLPPVRGGGNQGYHTASNWAVATALVALLHRDVTGEGQHLDVNMNAAQNVTTEAASYSWLVAQQTVQRQTGRHAGVVPSAPVQVVAGDGRYVTTGFAPRRPDQIRTLMEWMETLDFKTQFEEWPLLEVGANLDHDITIASIQEGGEDAVIFGAVRNALVYVAEHVSAYDFFVGAQSRDMQCGIIYTPDEVIEDRHIRERGFPTEVVHPELGETFIYPGAPYKMPASPWAISRRAPLLGEHNAEVLAELGMSEPDQHGLRAAGVM